jgi:thiol-disulfide isomerase/thioredoxin
MAEAHPRTDRIWLYAAIGFALFWIVYLTFFGPRRRALLENSALREPAVYDWPLLDLNDQPVSFSQFKNKPVFLNIWATWCGPCVGEMPSIAELARDPQLAGTNIQFVCVSTDDASATVRRFLQGKNWSMTFLRAEKFPPVFSTDGIPATFIIAPDGRIVASEVGAGDWHEQRVVDYLKKLAATTNTTGAG